MRIRTILREDFANDYDRYLDFFYNTDFSSLEKVNNAMPPTGGIRPVLITTRDEYGQMKGMKLLVNDRGNTCLIDSHVNPGRPREMHINSSGDIYYIRFQKKVGVPSSLKLGGNELNRTWIANARAFNQPGDLKQYVIEIATRDHNGQNYPPMIYRKGGEAMFKRAHELLLHVNQSWEPAETCVNALAAVLKHIEYMMGDGGKNTPKPDLVPLYHELKSEYT